MPSCGLKYDDLHMYLNIAHRFVLQSIIVLASDIQLLYMHITVEIESNNISIRHLSSCVCMNNFDEFVLPFPEQQVMKRGGNYVLALSNITLKSYHTNQVISTLVAMAGSGRSDSSLLTLEVSKCDQPAFWPNWLECWLATLECAISHGSNPCGSVTLGGLVHRLG